MGHSRERMTLSMIILPELSEDAEAHALVAMDDKLPEYKGVGVELADAQIRILDRLGAEKFATAYRGAGCLISTWAFDDFFASTRTFDEVFTWVVRTVSAAAEADRKGCREIACAELNLALNEIEVWGRSMGFDMHELREAKREYNRHRKDHKLEARKAEGGKEY